MNPTACDSLHTYARIGTNSLFANTTWIFFRIFNLTLPCPFYLSQPSLFSVHFMVLPFNSTNLPFAKFF